ncbi:caspase family protein [Candidatus Ponderosibacter sp. Uisw_141_02]|uniref:caspase family protein n=1 Tax=Candidatus Ponderosibacter sp. Uisw_141_02 TaxID=3231000 RepID=UPI003D5ADC60
MSLGFKKNITLFEAGSFAALTGFFLLALGGFVLFPIKATAGNWNVGKSSGKTFDYTKIQTRSVPRSFPEYSFTLDQNCKTQKGSKWSDRLYAYVSNDFFWSGAIGRNQSRLYTGKRANRNLFVITVSEASTKWRDKPVWIQYRLKGKNVVDALLKGVTGRYESGGGYWRECTLKLSQLRDVDSYKNNNRPFLAQTRALEAMELSQAGVLHEFFGHGWLKDEKYDFVGLANKLEVAAAEERRKAEAELAIKRSKEEARLAKLQKEAALRLKKKQDERIAESETAQKQVNEELKQAEALLAKKKAAEIARLKAVEEGRRKSAEEARLAAAEAAKKKAEEEARIAAAEAARKKAKEEARLAAAEAARKKAEEEKRQAEIELARKRKAEKSQLLALEKLQKKAEEEARLAAAEAARKKAEEEARLAAAEAARKKAEEEARLAAAEAARKKAEEEARLAAAEAARKKAEEEARLAASEAARKKAEQQKQLLEIAEAKKMADEQLKLAEAAELALKKADDEASLTASELDKSPPKIFAEITQAEGPEAVVEGTISDDVGVKFANVDGEALKLAADGSFTSVVYIPRSGKTLTFIASDDAGKKTEFKLELVRGKTSRPTRQKFAALNPVKRKAASNKNAIAMIIGIADYERTSARAAYADDDAKYFYDYATLKLGVPEENVLELINDRADRTELKIATKSWLKKAVSPRQSDVFVFFAGHGMASDNGNNMFLLPYDGAPELLEESAIRRDVLFGDIDATNPRSVTVFLDTCYSGTSRSEEQLVSARPVSIKAKPQSIPKKFTVITAAGNDQTAKPLEEVKHGMFSYFVMRGLEGDADGNSDKKITAGELHKYVQKNVDRYSAGSQTPQIQGNADAVLVRFQ